MYCIDGQWFSQLYHLFPEVDLFHALPCPVQLCIQHFLYFTLFLTRLHKFIRIYTLLITGLAVFSWDRTRTGLLSEVAPCCWLGHSSRHWNLVSSSSLHSWGEFNIVPILPFLCSAVHVFLKFLVSFFLLFFVYLFLGIASCFGEEIK